jgi:hypothetical protein
MSESASKQPSPSNSKKTWYTYLLIDPRDWSVFYVGKGTGARMHSHQRDAERFDVGGNPRKYARIREILDAGFKVVPQVFARYTEEEEAFDCEDFLIETLGEQLTNIAGSRAMERKERCDWMLKRLKPLSEWIRTASQSSLEFAVRYAGSPEAFYRKFVAEIEKESHRTGGNTFLVDYAHR